MFVQALDGSQYVNLARAAALRLLPPDPHHDGYAVAAVFAQRITVIAKCDTRDEAQDELDRFALQANGSL